MLFHRFLFLIAAAAMAACTGQPQQQPVAFTGSGNPAMWKVSDANDNSAYIFGTVHLLPPDTDWQGPAINAAIGQSRSLVTEVIGLDDAAAVSKIFAHLGKDKLQPPLTERLPADLADELASASRQVAGSVDQLDDWETWAAALTIGSAMRRGQGMTADLGADNVLRIRFAAMDKPHFGLETIAQQFGYFDQLPEKEQRVLLAAALRQREAGRRQMQRLLSNWMRGDVDVLLKDGSRQGEILASPLLRKVLLDDRTKNWAEQVASMIKDGKAPFVAVGAAHVAGPGGLPALLMAQGYKVERIQ